MTRAGQSAESPLIGNWRSTTVACARNAKRRVERLAKTLESAYRTPDLGNLEDPLDEAVFIILTYQTDLKRARTVWSLLKSTFPTWDRLLETPAAELERVLRPGGFQRTKAKVIRNLLRAVQDRWGNLSLDALATMNDADAEAELRSLPGMDMKGARCVLLYSQHREVFPVDSNTLRFMKRFGVIDEEARYRRASTHIQIEGLIPSSLRRSLHVNLVAHGQTSCLPRNPKCGSCPVRRMCRTGRGRASHL